MLNITIAAAVAALTLAAAASATPPTSTVVSVDATFTNDFDCPFPLQETTSGAYKTCTTSMRTVSRGKRSSPLNPRARGTSPRTQVA